MTNLIIGCGYLGSRVARLWINSGQAVAALTRSHQRAEQFLAQQIQPVVGDVTLPNSLQQLPECDTLLFAVGYDRSASADKRSVYVDGLRHALHALKDRCNRVVYVSSTSVYGQSDGQWIDESSPCEPSTEGGQICLDAEQVVKQMCKENKMHHGILRLSGIYGPGRLLRSVERLKSGEPIAGNPNAWLNLTHVDDAATAVLACEQHGGDGEICLINDGSPCLRSEYYQKLAELTGSPTPEFLANQSDSPNAPGKKTASLVSSRGRPYSSLNKRCRNDRMLNELKVKLTYPDYPSGLQHAISSANQSD